MSIIVFTTEALFCLPFLLVFFFSRCHDYFPAEERSKEISINKSFWSVFFGNLLILFFLMNFNLDEHTDKKELIQPPECHG